MAEFIVVLGCVALNAVFASVEMAFVAISAPALRALARKGNAAAGHILKLRDHPERTLSVIQIGITFVGAIAAAVGGAVAEETISPYLQTVFGLAEGAATTLAIMIVVLLLTYVSVVIGELVPKSLALRYPQLIAFYSARWLSILDRALSPAVSLLETSTKAVLRLFEIPSQWPGSDATSMDSEGRFEQLSEQHQEYVLNLVNLERRRVRDILVPWDQVDYLDISRNPAEVESLILESGHTRIPVVRDDQVVGILHAKEFLAFQKAGGLGWNLILRPTLRVNESDSLLKALKYLQENRSHLSVVYSGEKKIGIITLEDIIEDVIGDLFDENDDGTLKRILSRRATGTAFGPGIRE
jgi:putative hemolysin